MTDLPKRILTAVIFGVVVIGSVFGGQYTSSLLVILIGSIGLSEFYALTPLKGNRFGGLYILLGSLCGFSVLLSLNNLTPAFWVPILISGLLIVVFTELFNNSGTIVGQASTAIFGWVYVIVPLILFLVPAFRINVEGIFQPLYLMGYLVILWASDSGAYFAGVSFGKHKLFERVSPKKTWEGLAGGLVMALVAAWLAAKYTNTLQPATWYGMAFIITIFGTLGDLVESSIKRGAGVKDSGKLLPGHGGVLDRFDALLLSSPVVFIYLLIMGMI